MSTPIMAELDNIESTRRFADQALARAAGAPLIEGNQVQLLKDARQNYPAWLDAIGVAKIHIHFESYIIHEDGAGREFADALIAKAQEGDGSDSFTTGWGASAKRRDVSGTTCVRVASRFVVTIHRALTARSVGSRATTVK